MKPPNIVIPSKVSFLERRESVFKVTEITPVAHRDITFYNHDLDEREPTQICTASTMLACLTIELVPLKSLIKKRSYLYIHSAEK